MKDFLKSKSIIKDKGLDKELTTIDTLNDKKTAQLILQQDLLAEE